MNGTVSPRLRIDPRLMPRTGAPDWHVITSGRPGEADPARPDAPKAASVHHCTQSRFRYVHAHSSEGARTASAATSADLRRGCGDGRSRTSRARSRAPRGGYARVVTATELGLPALRSRTAAPRDPARTRRPAARRPVRPGRHRPARLADRPLQPALHLLHARRGPALAAARRAAHRRRARPADRHRGPRPRHARGALHRRRAAAAPRARATSIAASAALRAAPGDLADHQRHRPRPPRRRAAPPPGSTGSTSRSTPSPRPLRRDHPPRPARRRARRPGRRPRRRPDPGQDQHRADARASTTTRPSDLLRFAVDHGYELRFIEQMPLDAQHGWQRAEMVTADEILAALRAAFTLTPDGRRARRGPGRALARRRRPGARSA